MKSVGTVRTRVALKSHSNNESSVLVGKAIESKSLTKPAAPSGNHVSFPSKSGLGFYTFTAMSKKKWL